MDTKLKTTALVVLLVSVATAMAASVTPTLIDPWSNAWEQGYCAGFDYCYKFEGPPGGNIPEGISTVTIYGNTITIDVDYIEGEPKSFDWTSTYPISAVIVKNGVAGAYLYEYDPPVTSDTGLWAPEEKGISHITFCWNGPVATPEFPLDVGVITATGLLATVLAIRRRQRS